MEIDPHDQVLYDNIVPRYSQIATVTPTRIVVIGVYLLLGPTGLALLIFSLGSFTSSPTIQGFFVSVIQGVAGVVCWMVIFQTHRRYRQYLKSRQ